MPGIKTVRRMLQVDAGANGAAGGNPDTVGQRHRRLCRRKRRARKHT